MNVPLFYFAALLIVLGWWTAAFRSPTAALLPPPTATLQAPTGSFRLSPLVKENILAALNGNTALMQELIFVWQLEAEKAKQAGFQNIQSLSNATFWQSQILSPTSRPHPGTVLPQTEFSAAVALALLPPHEIAAIPSTLRKKEELFPKHLTNQVPLDIDRYRAEELFSKAPRLAFVAHYTDPNVLQTLRNQAIPLVSLQQVDDLETICAAIRTVGNACGCPEKAELLALFTEAATKAIDNHFSIWIQQHPSLPQRVLYLSYYRHFTVPTEKPVVGQLLKRSGLKLSPLQQRALAHNDWSLPVSQEEILADNCDALILSSNGADHIEQVCSSPSFRTLAARQLGHIAAVDDGTQQMISQHLVIAYLDLYQVMTHEVANEK